MRIRCCFCLMLALLLLAQPSFSLAENAQADAVSHRGIVRVYLSSLGNPSALNLTLTCDYTADGSQQRTLSAGQKVKVSFDKASGAITLTADGQSYAMGRSVTLRRHSAESRAGLRIAEGRVASNVYPCDLTLTAKASGSAWRLYPVANVYMEDYLTGVLPYEMGNSAALEALKAQAVAARTYTINRMNQRGGYIYDLVDTTNDQVYNGNNESTARCTEAVHATAGLVLHYGGKPIIAYYSASNGGQTESAKNAWGSVGYNYLTVKDDPFDRMNTSAVVKRTKIYANCLSDSQPTRIRVLLNGKARSVLSGRGINAESVQVRTIHAVTPIAPRYPEPSALCTKLLFDVTAVADDISYDLTLSCDIFTELESAFGMSINSSSNELWSVAPFDGGFAIEARRFGHGIGMSQRGAMQMGQLGYTYEQILAFYYEGCELVRYDLGGAAPAAAVPSGAVIATVRSNTQGLRLALINAPTPYATVLTGLLPGSVVTVLDQGAVWSLVTVGGLTGYAATDCLQMNGAPSAPVTAAPSTVSQWAVVNVNGVLNLRAAPSYEANVPATIPNGEILPVYEVIGEWARVQFGSLTGYCAMSFLQLRDAYPLPVYIGAEAVQTPAPQMPAATPAPVYTQEPAFTLPGVPIQQPEIVLPQATPMATPSVSSSAGDTLYARVNTEYGKLNLRIRPQSGAAVLLTIPKDAVIPVLSRSGGWVKTTYGGKTGYVQDRYLVFSTGFAPEASAGTTVKAWVITDQGSLNMRKKPSTSAALVDRVPQGAVVSVLDSLGEWCYISYAGKTGYALSRYLSANPPEPRVYDTTLQSVSNAQARVIVSEAVVYRWCSETAAAAGRLYAGMEAEMTQRGDTWCKIRYEGLEGYCKTELLYLTEAN